MNKEFREDKPFSDNWSSMIYCTTFCNKGHRLSDGKPVGHECFVVPTAALVAEKEGNVSKAIQILDQWKNRRKHNGLREKQR